MNYDHVLVISYRKPVTKKGKRYNDFIVVIAFGKKPKVITEMKIPSTADESRRSAIIREATKPTMMTQTLRLGIQGILLEDNPTFFQDSVMFLRQEMTPESFEVLLKEKGVPLKVAS